MTHSDRNTLNPLRRRTDSRISRRAALSSSGGIMLSLLVDCAFGQGEEKPAVKPPEQAQGRVEQSRAFMERLRQAGSMEERQQIMSEQAAWQRQRAFEDLKAQLGLSDQEWSVVKPRLQRVYDLVRSRMPAMGRNEQPKTEVEQRSRELSELLRDEKAEVSQIRAKLTALRAAKERTVQELIKARQSLRQVLTLRQEAILVLNALLD